MRSSGFYTGTALLAFCLLGSGCDLGKFAANSTADIFERAGPAFQQHWDYEFAGAAAPGSTMQLEGLHRVSPDNEIIHMALARAYMGYTYGWIEDDLMRVDPMDMDEEERIQRRARWMYMRARYFAFKVMTGRHDGFTEAYQAGLEPFNRYLQEEFDEPEHAEELFWAGYTWAAAINVSRDDPDMIADFSFARALVERQVELDRGYFNGGGVTFLAVINASLGAAFGGDPEVGRELFEEALVITDRKFLLIQYNYARTYAMQTNNRELFDELVNEILTAGDISHEFRLTNKIAVRRTRWLRDQADDHFF
ncbi:MAG: hypothetical protein JRH11_03220 [Deltaproteobacteria bacterium]|nr:hypothetical protein [Deltaproteobacteria bacterium]